MNPVHTHSLIEPCFRWAVVVVLAITSAAKIVSLIIGQNLMFLQPDPVFWFSTTKQVLIVATVFEILLALTVSLSQSALFRQALIAYAMLLFSMYHIASWLTGDPKPCSCLGGVLSWFGLAGIWSYIVPYSLIFVMFAGSSALVFVRTRDSVRTRHSPIGHPRPKDMNLLTVVLVLFGSSMIGSLDTAVADGCCASGELRVNRFFNGKAYDDARQSFTNTFKVCISGDGRWRLEITDTVASLDQQNASRSKSGVPLSILAYDGRDLFYVRNEVQNVGASGRVGSLQHASYISSGPIPVAPNFARDGRQIIWLGFFGGLYFRDHPQQNIPLPWQPARRSLLAFGFRSIEVFSTKFPTLLESSEFVRDESLDLNRNEELERSEFDVPLTRLDAQQAMEDIRWRKSGWKNGQRAALLTLIRGTNVSGIEIPLLFRMERADPVRTSSPYVYECVVNEVRALRGSDGRFRPELTHKTIVEDSRFRYRGEKTAVNYIAYEMQAGEEWKDTSDPNLLAIFASAKENLRRYNYFRRRRIALAIYCLFGASVISIGILLYHRLQLARE